MSLISVAASPFCLATLTGHLASQSGNPTLGALSTIGFRNHLEALHETKPKLDLGMGRKRKPTL
jgi:hypothetical protein